MNETTVTPLGPVYCPSCAARLSEHALEPGTLLRCPVCGTDFKYEPAQTSEHAIAESDKPAIAATSSGASTKSTTRRPSTEEILLERLKHEPQRKKPLPSSSLIILLIAILGVSFGIVKLTSKPDAYAPVPQGDSSVTIQRSLVFQHVIDSLQRILVVHPDDTGVQLSLADAYYDEGQWMQSMKEFETYLASNPKNADARTGYAFAIAQSSGNFNAALAQFDTALKYDPDNLNTLVNAGIMTAQTVTDTNHASAIIRARSYFVHARLVAKKTDAAVAMRIDTLIQELDNAGQRMAKP